MNSKENMERNFIGIYDKFKLMFYKGIFGVVKERSGSLSAMEAFSLEVIDMLDRPTISAFADFLNISQSNATYKINCLMEKGYIIRRHSETDRREYHLELSDKYRNYIGIMSSYEKRVVERISERFSEEEIESFAKMLNIISTELMPECDVIA